MSEKLKNKIKCRLRLGRFRYDMILSELEFDQIIHRNRGEIVVTNPLNVHEELVFRYNGQERLKYPDIGFVTIEIFRYTRKVIDSISLNES